MGEGGGRERKKKKGGGGGGGWGGGGGGGTQNAWRKVRNTCSMASKESCLLLKEVKVPLKKSHLVRIHLGVKANL